MADRRRVEVGNSKPLQKLALGGLGSYEKSSYCWSGLPKLDAAFWPAPGLGKRGLEKRIEGSGGFRRSGGPSAADSAGSRVETNRRVGRSHGELCEPRTFTQRA